MAVEAVGLLRRRIQQAPGAAGGVGPVAALAGVCRDRGCFGVRPRVGRDAVPGPGGSAVVARGPVVLDVAGLAQRRRRVGHHQELAVGVVMRFVTGGALQATVRVQPHLARLDERCRVGELAARCAQRGVVDEGHRMVVGQVGADERDAADRAGHADLRRPAQHLAQRDGAVVAAQAQLRRAVRLPGRALARRARVRRVTWRR